MTTGGQVVDLVARSRRLADLAERRLALEPRAPSARERARRLRDHLEGFVLPRADIDAPLLVVLIGSTGAGKSSLLNAIAGANVSRAGVLRPTTREAVVYASPDDVRSLREGRLRRVPAERLVVAAATPTSAGVAIIDAPDIDSLERDNRALADTLLEACDLCVFVTTATRYADLVPWNVLERIRQRQVPLAIVLNRLPTDAADREIVIADVTRLFADHGMTPANAGLAILRVDEGEVDADIDALSREATRPLADRIRALREASAERRTLATQALAGGVRGLAPLAGDAAADLESEAAESEGIRRIAEEAYAAELRQLSTELRSGVLLRAEVLRQWQEFVGADQIARFMSSGLARLRGMLLFAIRGTPPAPV